MVGIRAGVTMNDTQRIIGELKEFKRATLDRLSGLESQVDDRFEKLQKKVDALNAFKWKATGMMAAVVFIMELAGQIVRAGTLN